MQQENNGLNIDVSLFTCEQSLKIHSNSAKWRKIWSANPFVKLSIYQSREFFIKNNYKILCLHYWSLKFHKMFLNNEHENKWLSC